MKVATLRLTGIVSERPAIADPLRLELRELIAENDRLIERNKALKTRLDTALDRVAELEAGAGPAPLQPILTLGRLHLNYDLRLLSLNGRTVHLAQRGLEILAYLMDRPDRVIQPVTLARALGHTDADAVRTVLYRVRPCLATIGAELYLRCYGRSWAGGGHWMTADHEVVS